MSMNVAENKVKSPNNARKPTVFRGLRRVESVDEEEKKKDSILGKDSKGMNGGYRQVWLLQSNLSLNASCSSDASTDSFVSRASTGRTGRVGFSSSRRKSVTKPKKVGAKIVTNDDLANLVDGKSRCAWVTPNTDLCYAAFHDEEWGVAVHDDKKLFELLVLSSALTELSWPMILSKRHIFREVFMQFNPDLVSKFNEKKIVAPRSTAISLLSEPKLRAIIENARQVLKIVEEFGSFDRYCWSFVNQKPIISRFRYSRQVPVKTPKADVISKDLMRRGFRSVGPTIIYSFMQAAGLTNDHLVSCYRFKECDVDAEKIKGSNNHKFEGGEEKGDKDCEELGIIDLDGLSVFSPS